MPTREESAELPETEHSHASRSPRRGMRVVRLVAFGIAGTLLATSALNAQGEDLRAASVTDLSTVVRAQRADTDALKARVTSLSREVNDLSRTVGDRGSSRLQRQIDNLQDPAGLTPHTGAGVTVTLTDAPESAQDAALANSNVPVDRLIVHQQDIQAVVNALWLGGADAVSVQGQRVISTTGIKCAGPTVILHGVPFPPPYVIRAVGDPFELSQALSDSDYIQAYRQDSANYGVGYREISSSELNVPAYDGSFNLRYAKALPARSAGQS